MVSSGDLRQECPTPINRGKDKREEKENKI